MSLLGLQWGCSPTAQTANPASTAPAPTSAPVPPKPDVVAANIDTSIKPGDDFFAFANGAWLKTHAIPASESSWGIGPLVTEDLNAKLRTTSEEASAAKNAAPGSDQQKVGDFWATAMDTALADRLGITPLRADLERIDAIKDLAGALDVTFALQREDLDPLFGFGVGQDEKASDVMAVYLMQGGLGLPDRDFYFNKEAGVAKIREAYVAHMSKVLQLLPGAAGDTDARARAVMVFETSLAKISRPLAQLRDPLKNYNKMAPTQLTHQLTPAIAWEARFGEMKLAPGYVIVGQPNSLQACNPCWGRHRCRCCATICGSSWWIPTRLI